MNMADKHEDSSSHCLSIQMKWANTSLTKEKMFRYLVTRGLTPNSNLTIFTVNTALRVVFTPMFTYCLS